MYELNHCCLPLPFVLLHRSGVTREVYYTIFDMASQGNSFSDIEKFLLWRYQEKHSMALLSYVGVKFNCTLGSSIYWDDHRPEISGQRK